MRELLLFVVTWAGPALSIGMLAPIAWQPIADRGVAGLSATGSVVTAVTVQLWLTYGILVGDPRQISVNVVVTAVRVAIAVAVVWACRDARARGFGVAAAAAGVALAFTSAAAVGAAATTLSTINRAPQAAYTVKRGRGAGLSVAGFALGAVADTAWLSYGIVYRDPFVFSASLICALFDALIVLAAVRPEHPLIAALRRAITPAVTPDLTPPVAVVAGD